MTFGSLFAGIGGFDLGLVRAGMIPKWQVEIDEYCRLVLDKSFPGVQRFRDIRYFLGGKKWRCLRDHWKVDIIVGGFPCQDISNAGARQGLAGARSGLFVELLRVVRLLRPKFLLLENVAALVNRGLATVLRSLAEIGYDAEWHCLQAADFGAPHIRDRVFVLGHSVCQRWEKRRQGDNEQNDRNIIASANANSKPMAAFCADSYGLTAERLAVARQECRQWEFEPDVGRVADGISSRMDRLRGLGNAVVPQIAEFFGRQIMEAASASK